MSDLDLTRYDGHTPGPWQIGYDDGSGPENIVATDGGKKAAFARLRWGCSCCERRVEEYPLLPVEQANARLIADAPQLLAEVRRLREESERRLALASSWRNGWAPEIESLRVQFAALRQSHARLLAVARQAENWTLPRCICRPGEKCLGCELRAAVAEAEAISVE